MPLLEFTNNGIYCKQADVYLDPWRGVDKAIISHGHSDHARWGSKRYITHEINVPIITHRLGKILVTGKKYGEAFRINGVNFSFHPAGHVPGSSQIRVEYKGEVWVFTGDYKTQVDGISTPFELIKCNTFITECTFGLPVFKWDAPLNDLDNWPRCVQVAWQIHDKNGELVSQKSFLIKPSGFSIPYESEKVHGISTALADKLGASLEQVLDEFYNAVNHVEFLIGHNISFDRNILGAEFLRLGLNDVLEERSKELYWECTRRTDLIRHNKYTNSDMLWAFKGGETNGAAVEDFRTIYPLPTYDIVNNPNLNQNVGY